MTETKIDLMPFCATAGDEGSVLGSAMIIPLQVSFNEMLSLKWGLERLLELTNSGVVPVPKDREGFLRPAIDKVLHRLAVIGPEAEKRVEEEARKEKSK